MNKEDSIEYLRDRLCDTDERKGVIDLLKEGEKYKKILAEVEERLIPGKIIEYDTRINIANLGALDLIKMIIEDVKQKYFPEKSKAEEIIEVLENISTLGLCNTRIPEIISLIKDQAGAIADLQQRLAKTEYRYMNKKGGLSC